MEVSHQWALKDHRTCVFRLLSHPTLLHIWLGPLLLLSCSFNKYLSNSTEVLGRGDTVTNNTALGAAFYLEGQRKTEAKHREGWIGACGKLPEESRSSICAWLWRGWWFLWLRPCLCQSQALKSGCTIEWPGELWKMVIFIHTRLGPGHLYLLKAPR